MKKKRFKQIVAVKQNLEEQACYFSGLEHSHLSMLYNNTYQTKKNEYLWKILD